MKRRPTLDTKERIIILAGGTFEWIGWMLDSRAGLNFTNDFFCKTTDAPRRTTMRNLAFALLPLLAIWSETENTAAATAYDPDTLEKTRPAHTYFVPLPESTIFEHTFLPLSTLSGDSTYDDVNVTTVISISIAVDNTVIWYDHWEDGFDTKCDRYSPTTQVWGDGNIRNGCAPGTKCDSDADDVLHPTQKVVLENDVPVSRMARSKLLYDGSDRILTSYPVTITRGCVSTPSLSMSGITEVLDIKMWGTNFVAPVGNPLWKASNHTVLGALEHVSMFILAAEPGTELEFPDGDVKMEMGETRAFTVRQGDTFWASKKVQVHLITGTATAKNQIDMSWISLLPRDSWSNEYVSPIGGSRILIYNPESDPMSVDVKRRGLDQFQSLRVPAGSSQLTQITPSGEAVAISSRSGVDFFAMSVNMASDGGRHNWACGLFPYSLLASQVLVGSGIHPSQEVVYVSPTTKADIYFNRGGGDYLVKGNADGLSTIEFAAEKGNDVSGMIIWATHPGTGTDGTPVTLSAAWGSNADANKRKSAMSIPPFGPIHVVALVKLAHDADDDGEISCGDTLTYTLLIQNTAARDIRKYALSLSGLGNHLPRQQLVSGSCSYFDGVDQKVICTNTALSDGTNPFTLTKRGGYHQITYNTTIDPINEVTGAFVSSSGTVGFADNLVRVPFHISVRLALQPGILLEKTIHKGMISCLDDTKGIDPADARYVRDIAGAEVTICFEVKNTGGVYLEVGNVVDEDLGFSSGDLGILEPQQSHHLVLQMNIRKESNSIGSVSAQPIWHNGLRIPHLGRIADTSMGGISILVEDARIKLEKTVHLGHWKQCSSGSQREHGYRGDKITYCYLIQNIGSTFLNRFQVVDENLGFSSRKVPLLGPNESYYLGHHTKIERSITSVAEVSALPVNRNGQPLEGRSEVKSSDPAGVIMFDEDDPQCNLPVDKKIISNAD